MAHNAKSFMFAHAFSRGKVAGKKVFS